MNGCYESELILNVLNLQALLTCWFAVDMLADLRELRSGIAKNSTKDKRNESKPGANGKSDPRA